MQNKVIEWYTHNSLRRFPVSERANLVSDLGVELPNALIVDGLYHSCFQEISISTLQFTGDLLTVKFSDDSYFTVNPSSYTRYDRIDIFDKCGVPKGLVNLGESFRFLNDIFGSKLHTFSNCLMESSFVYLIEESVTSIGIPDETALVGDVNIRFGSGTNFREDGNIITVDTFNNLNKDCEEEFQQPLLTINGVSPDSNGVIHLGVGGIITKEPIQNGIAIGTVIEGEGAECLERLDPGQNGSPGAPGPQGNAGPRGACAQVKAICCLCEQCNTVETCATCETCNTCEQCNTCETCNTCEANDSIGVPEPPIPDPPETSVPNLCPDCVEVTLLFPFTPEFPNPIIMEEVSPETDGCEYLIVIDLVEYRLEYVTDRWVFSITDISFTPFTFEVWESVGPIDTALAGPYTDVFTFNLIFGLSVEESDACDPETFIIPDIITFNAAVVDPGLVFNNQVMKRFELRFSPTVFQGRRSYKAFCDHDPYNEWTLDYFSPMSSSPNNNLLAATWSGWELTCISRDAGRGSGGLITELGRIVAYRTGNIDNVLGAYTANIDETTITVDGMTIAESTPNDILCTEFGLPDPPAFTFSVPQGYIGPPRIFVELFNNYGDPIDARIVSRRNNTQFFGGINGFGFGTPPIVLGLNPNNDRQTSSNRVNIDNIRLLFVSGEWELEVNFQKSGALSGVGSTLNDRDQQRQVKFRTSGADFALGYVGSFCQQTFNGPVAFGHLIPGDAEDDRLIISHAVITYSND